MPEQQMPTVLKTLAYTSYVSGALTAVFGLAAASFIPSLINGYMKNNLGAATGMLDLSGLISTVSLVVGIGMIGFGIFQIALGWGYVHKKRWARSATLSTSIVSLIFGVFTLLGGSSTDSIIPGLGGMMFMINLISLLPIIYITYYFLKPEIKAWFEISVVQANTIQGSQIMVQITPQETKPTTVEKAAQILKPEKKEELIPENENLSPEEKKAKQYILNYKKTYNKEDLALGLESREISKQKSQEYINKYF